MRTKAKQQLNLFVETPVFDTESQYWNEVPQDVFLNWPERNQLEYCAARDEHSAKHTDEDEPERKQWFLERAGWYRGCLSQL